MTFSNAQIISTLTATGITPMFYHGDKEVARKIIDVSYEGGVRVIEFTNRGPNAFEVYTDLLKYAEKYEGLIIGIGTIILSCRRYFAPRWPRFARNTTSSGYLAPPPSQNL